MPGDRDAEGGSQYAAGRSPEAASNAPRWAVKADSRGGESAGPADRQGARSRDGRTGCAAPARRGDRRGCRGGRDRRFRRGGRGDAKGIMNAPDKNRPTIDVLIDRGGVIEIGRDP